MDIEGNKNDPDSLKKSLEIDTKESENQAGKSQVKSLLCALMAGMCFAVANYILGNNSRLGMLTREASENGSLVFTFLYAIYLLIQSIRHGKSFWRWQDSNFCNPETGGFYWTNFFGACIYTLINCAAGFGVIFTFQYALYGNMNQGILTSLFGLSSIFSAILAYYAFGDRLKIFHVLGMILMLICIIGLGFGSTKNMSSPGVESDSSNPIAMALIAVLFGILSPVLFALGGLTVRYYNTHYNFDAFDMTITMYILDNIILIIAMIFTYKYGSHPFILSEYTEIVASGFVACIGVVLLNQAITSGLAGPVFALANVQVVIQTILDAVLLGNIPTLIEIISATFGILGCCTIAVGPQIYKKFNDIFYKQKSE
mmetsp:Transcript_18623/g.16493  ORF Transcript_18623/g.16493 Transcript_18623/m.16493 type:complete len:371 (+) Transcript_18623:56-1168(+)